MNTKRAYMPVLAEDSGVSAPDSIDREILHLLQQSGRATNEEVGHAIGLSPSAASRRIHALEARGIILGYQALVDKKVMGAQIMVFVRVTLEKQSATALQGFESAVRKCESVVSCHLMAGEYDYMLQVRVASMADYERVHKQSLSRFPGISRLESNFAVRDVMER